ncbi:MAG: IS66 family transposase [Actinomycetota bacterium]|nr:IS66 family transposase [Actinomycetota bacterium]
MGMDAAIQAELRTIIDAVLRGDVSETQAGRVYELGRDAVTAFVLATAKRITEMGPAPGPHTPSGSIPPYAKPSASRRERKPPGARAGHEGRRRPTPPPDARVEVETLTTCPECHGQVHPARRRRTRTIEDMPRDAKVTATEYSIPSHWCPCCRKHVEPRVSAALPRCAIGNNLAAMTVVFHYGLGLTIDQTRDVLLSPLRARVSAGGLAALWQRVAEVLLPWYEHIGETARHSAVLHADETGWRVNGQTHWLWCFCNDRTCYYMIDEGRGAGALHTFFTKAFGGVLIHDFWRPYGSVLLRDRGEHQCCLAHLLRELEHVDAKHLPGKSRDRAEEWSAFVKMLKRLIRDGIRLRRRVDFTPRRYASRIMRIDARLRALAEAEYADEDAARLANRLRRHQDELFTFLDRPEADWNNNLAERMIRPAVILRKGSQCNRSERGAATQAVLMTVYRTLKLRDHDPRQAIADALTGYAATGTLPPMPEAVEGG